MHVATALPLITAAILGSPCTKFISDSDVNSDVLLGYTMNKSLLYKQPPASVVHRCVIFNLVSLFLCTIKYYFVRRACYLLVVLSQRGSVCVWEGGGWECNHTYHPLTITYFFLSLTLLLPFLFLFQSPSDKPKSF